MTLFISHFRHFLDVDAAITIATLRQILQVSFAADAAA